MGQPKLLLPWPSRSGAEITLIDKVLDAWTRSRVANVVVVMRRDDEMLRTACERWPVSIIQPDDSPSDMKASIQIGLRFLEQQFRPAANDRCFIAPADLPSLTSRIIDQMIDTESSDSTIVVPQFGNRQAHPALVPWLITSEVFDLADDEGVNCVVDRHPKLSVPFAVDDLVDDIDTMEEYQIALQSAQLRQNRTP